MNQRFVKAYLEQGAQYYSASKETFQAIHEMHPRHAANAARRMLLDADVWARDAGMDQDPHSRYIEHPHLWLTRTSLYVALVTQAGF